jgi:hypothetical protein
MRNEETSNTMIWELWLRQETQPQLNNAETHSQRARGIGRHKLLCVTHPPT